MLFELLSRFYEKFQEPVDSVLFAKSFLDYNANFYGDVAKAYFELGQWEETIKTLKEALNDEMYKKIKGIGEQIR